jgi:hypothetical protein
MHSEAIESVVCKTNREELRRAVNPLAKPALQAQELWQELRITKV